MQEPTTIVWRPEGMPARSASAVASATLGLVALACVAVIALRLFG